MKNTLLIIVIALAITAATFLLAFLLTQLPGFVKTDKVEARAEGKCIQCHLRETPAIVAAFESSPHANSLTCLDCHHPINGEAGLDHHGFTIVRVVTSGNCAECHAEEYRQFLRSRHAAPAWTAVAGIDGVYAGHPALSAEQIAQANQYHPDAMTRKAHPLAVFEGSGAVENGCGVCHEIGAPNADGSLGNCSKCHLRHYVSVVEARTPETCGACHMGPDHSQVEIYNESTHGVLYRSRQKDFNLSVKSANLTTKDMPSPTCSTCHMSGLNGGGMTHDVGERLSYYLFKDISDERPNGMVNRERMKTICLNCHAQTKVDNFYTRADLVLAATNEKISQIKAIYDGWKRDKLINDKPFDEPEDFMYFDLWHYFGRTAKHGAYMGGADYVQWHGNYELYLRLTEFQKHDAELRGRK
jgi:hydroxylamine dehydrogenase